MFAPLTTLVMKNGTEEPEETFQRLKYSTCESQGDSYNFYGRCSRSFSGMALISVLILSYQTQLFHTAYSYWCTEVKRQCEENETREMVTHTQNESSQI